MKTIAINGSPRKSWNTATMLQKALDGAQSKGSETKLVHLYDLNYKGCISCFACKRKDSKFIGHCAMRDDLTDVLEEIISADVLLVGSPIYLGDITGAARSFLERLVFMNLSYGRPGESAQGHGSNFNGKINTGFIYTMNIPAERVGPVGYQYNFDLHKRYLGLLNGEVKSLIVPDTYQFDDYQKYDALHFDERHKAKVKEEQFPVYCQQAFDLGAELASLNV
ncbi:MAG: flavodoxin family protein [Ethanoligenens sp.]